MRDYIKRLILIPHIKVHNANALSSPFTIGFPAMTAWLGATHALQRKLNSSGFDDLKFKATAIISHQCDLQTHKGVGDYVNSIIGTGNPLDQSGSRPAFIEEARCHLDVSLLIQYACVEKDDESELLTKITHILNAEMKIAGGDILSFNPPTALRIEEGVDQELKELTRKLMPGYAIIERRELMVEAMQDGQDSMDALLDYLAIHHSCEQDDNGNVTWASKRKTAGWIVPIATGFHGITELSEAKNQRDPETPHRFAESVVTLGEFKMPHRIKSINEILWKYQIEEENNLYLCQQETEL
jgi:CRISPR-associated protein Csy2